MNFKSLSNATLHEQTLLAAKTEKAATFALLEFLAEVDARRLYSERGYSTLWLYVHKALGYSESSASERVSAMGLMQAVPGVKEKIIAEELTLTSAVKLAAFVKREECEPEKAAEILEMISGLPTREVDKILAREQAEPALKRDHLKPSGPETTRVSFDADPEFMELFERLKDLQGNPALSMCERLKSALKTEVERKESFKPRRRSKKKTPAPPETKPEAESKSDSEAESESAPSGENPQWVRAPEVRKTDHASSVQTDPKNKIRSRFIPVSVKREVAQRSGGQCEFSDPVSGRRCECRFGLEFDHFPVPFARGGESTLQNLRHVCSSHNKLAAVQFYGREKMREFFR